MKIGIFTHPLINNYGGILQAYAFSQTLKKLGHEAVVFRLNPRKCFLKKIVLYFIYAFHIPPFYKRHLYAKTVLNNKSKNTLEFINSYINRTSELSSSKSLIKECVQRKLDCLIVGSDQVWRTDFALNYGLSYFFDFVPKNMRLKLFSYSASFGLDSWNYTHKQTEKIKQLLARFSAISVREYEGQKLCAEYLKVPSMVVIDPTLLLTSDDYACIVSAQKYSNYVFVYWLGDRTQLQEILKDIDKSKKIVEVRLRDGEILPSIEDWLSYIKYASFVITDSFHGCVFSIIFNKQFRVYLSNVSSNSRIKSLFKILEIDEKLTKMNLEINYKILNPHLDDLRKNAFKFLNENLK